MNQTIYMKIVPREGSAGADIEAVPGFKKGEWFASTLQIMKSPQTQVDACQKRADAQGLGCDYFLATKDEYVTYRTAIRAVIDGSRS